MSEEEKKKKRENWRYLWGLKAAANSVQDVYVSVPLLGGHYVRVSREDFLIAIDNMESLSSTHPHPKRFNFTIENRSLWVHSSMMGHRQLKIIEEGSGDQYIS
jgi:hypothetical protein